MQISIKTLKNWGQEHPIRLCVLFGSQATGKTHAGSDVDLAIWPTEPITTSTRLKWVRELEMILARDVNLVLVSADLDPVLGMEIARQGCSIFECEPGLWQHHRTQLWHSFNDSLPFLRASRQSLREFAEEVRGGS